MADVGPYRVIAFLGAGGGGTVYRARRRDDGLEVALKRIQARQCSADVRERFRREAEAAGSIRHPNVVHMLGHGESHDGSLWLAMEMLEGEDLRSVLTRGPLSPAEVVRIGTEAAAGLDAAHALGIVHRDVKPGNLFLCRTGAVKVLDFGLAVGMSATAARRVTVTGAPIGTPAYMAVEQVMGLHTEDGRTDVWGLGATLYAAVSGRLPFPAVSHIAQLFRIVHDEPDALPDSTPADLAAVLLRALRKDKGERWATVAAFREALLRVRPSALSVAASECPADDSFEPTLQQPWQSPVALAAEVRVVSVLLATDVFRAAHFGAAVQREQGRLVWLPGGTAVGVFGGEGSRGDEAERAVRAGLAVRADGAAQYLAVGTGRARIAKSGLIVGAAVSSAEAVLTDDGVGVDAATRRLVRGGRFAIEGTCVHERAVGRRTLETDVAEAPLYGRAQEVERLSAEVLACWAAGRAGGVILEGPAGIGKTRLVHAVLPHLAGWEHGFELLRGHAESHRAAEGWTVIVEAIRRWLRDDPQRERAQLVASLPEPVADALRSVLDPQSTRPSPRVMEINDAGRVAPLVRGALLELLDLAASTRPVILVVENLQWVDEATAALLSLVGTSLAHRPIFVLATRRAGQTVPVSGLATMQIGALSRSDTLALAEALLGPGRGDAIVDRCGGNPLFAEELALAARDGLADLPATIGAAIQVRLDRLDREDRDVLRRASVLGQRFWTEGLTALGVSEPAGALVRLLAEDLVEPEPRSRLGDLHEWSFRHDLVHEVVLGSLTSEQATALHEAAARWLAAVPLASPAEVAEHFEQAGSPSEAVEHWTRAAQRAFREGDEGLALRATERALARPRIETAYELHRIRTNVLWHLGRLRDADLAALDLAARSDTERGLAALRRIDLLRMLGRRQEALAVARSAIALAPDEPLLRVWELRVRTDAGELTGADVREILRTTDAMQDPVARALARAVLANAARVQGDLALMLELLDTVGNTLDQTGHHGDVAAVSINRAYVMLVLGRWSEAVEAFEWLATNARRSGDGIAEAYALHNLGLARARMGDLAAGLDAEGKAAQWAAASGHVRLQAGAAIYTALMLFEHERPAEALVALDEPGRPAAEALGAAEPLLLTVRAMVLCALGRRPEARTDAERALVMRRRAGGMEELEADLFLVAHDLGLPGALEEGVIALRERADRISDAVIRARYLAAPANARLLAAARV